jgi:hypothetical protein
VSAISMFMMPVRSQCLATNLQNAGTTDQASTSPKMIGTTPSNSCMSPAPAIAT